MVARDRIELPTRGFSVPCSAQKSTGFRRNARAEAVAKDRDPAMLRVQGAELR